MASFSMPKSATSMRAIHSKWRSDLPAHFGQLVASERKLSIAHRLRMPVTAHPMQ